MEGQKDSNQSVTSAVGQARSKSFLVWGDDLDNPLNVISKVLTDDNATCFNCIMEEKFYSTLLGF